MKYQNRRHVFIFGVKYATKKPVLDIDFSQKAREIDNSLTENTFW